MGGYREFIIGSGSRTVKDLVMTGGSKEFKDVTRLDNNEDHASDILWDLRQHPLHFDYNYFNEILRLSQQNQPGKSNIVEGNTRTLYSKSWRIIYDKLYTISSG